jgi:hypothetical protein
MSRVLDQMRRKTVLGLYRQLLKTGGSWPRWSDTPIESSLGNYIVRTTMERFRENKDEQDPQRTGDHIAFAQQELQSLRKLLNDNSKHNVRLLFYTAD